jgi:hypothetical protein
VACRGTREGCDALLVILIYRISGYTIEFADMMTAVSRLLWGGSLAVREDSWGINIPAALLACKGVRVGVPVTRLVRRRTRLGIFAVCV